MYCDIGRDQTGFETRSELGLFYVMPRAFNYIGTRKRCGPCALRPQCTSAAFRSLNIHQHEPARQRARELANTPEFAKAQRQRKKVEALFAELKKSDRTAPLASAEIEVRTGAVLLSGNGAEPETARPVPEQ